MEKMAAGGVAEKSLTIPPDEQRCCRNDGVRWRCTKFRMTLGASADDDGLDTKYCEHHYNFKKEQHKKQQLKKKTSSSEDDDDSSSSGTETWDSTFLEWKKVKNHRKGIIQATANDTISDIEGGSANLGTKRKNVQRTAWSGELDFPEKTSSITSHQMKKKEVEKNKLPSDEQRCCLGGRSWRCKNFRMGHGDDDASVPKSRHCEKHYNYYAQYHKNRQKKKKKRSGDGEGAAGPIRRKRKTVERTQGSGEPESSTEIREPVVEFESMDNYKRKCFELSVELEKKEVECIKLQDELADVKNAAQDETKLAPEDATEYWRKMFLDLESRVLRIENENLTMRCVEARVSNLESLVLWDGKGNSILDFRNSENIETAARCLQNDVTQSGENQRYKNSMSKPNAETRSEGRKDSHVYELNTEEKVLKNVYVIDTSKHHELESEFPKYSAGNISSGSRNLSSEGENVKEGKGWGCREGIPSQAHLGMSKNPFVKLVSDNSGESFGEDSDSSIDSKGSLGGLLDMMAMKYRNRINDREIKWKFEADMLSSIEEDPEICMKAVCALYRQQISEGAKGLFDALRGTTLAKFLTDGACEGDLKKSAKELEIFDSEGVEDCKRLARSYSKQLFSIYQNKKDPYFRPTTNATHEDQTTN